MKSIPGISILRVAFFSCLALPPAMGQSFNKPPSCSPHSCFYKFQILASNGDTDQVGNALTGFGDSPSIDDTGRGAFVGVFSNGQGVMLGDATSLTDITTGFVSPTRTFGRAVQINDQGSVVARDGVAGSPPPSFIRLWNTSGVFNVIASTTSLFSPYAAVFAFPSVNNNGDVVYSALDAATGTAIFLESAPASGSGGQLVLPNGSLPRPQIADNGSIVLRLGNLINSPIEIWDSTLTHPTAVAGAASFSETGNSPGISDDGQIVAFYGNLNASGAVKWNSHVGPGIFAWVNVAGGAPLLVRVAGVACDGNLDPGETIVPGACTNGNSDVGVFSGFVNTADSRVGVNATQIGAASPNGTVSTSFGERAVTIVYQAFDNSGVPGIYSSRLNFFGNQTSPFNPSAPASAFAGAPTLVVKVGDQIPGFTGTVNALNLSDPVNSRDRGDIVFWMSTTAGESAIIRARPQQVVYLDFFPAANFVPSKEPIAVTTMRNAGLIPTWTSDFPTYINSFGRIDLNSVSMMSNIVNNVQAHFNALDPTTPGSANVQVLGKPSDAVPVDGPYVRVFVGGGPYGPSANCFTRSSCFLFGVAPSIDVFNQAFEYDTALCASLPSSCSSPASGLQRVKTPMVFVDSIFRAAPNFQLDSTGAPVGLFTNGSGNAINLGNKATNFITQSQAENAIATIVSHEAGHTLGLRHLDNSLPEVFTMRRNPNLRTDALRNPTYFSNTNNPLTVLEVPPGNTENSGARLAFGVGSDSTVSMLRRDAPISAVLANLQRSNYSIAGLLNTGTVTVAHAFLGIVSSIPDGSPMFFDLGSGDLATLLTQTIPVAPADQIIVMASTTGTGIDIFGLPSGGGINLSNLDLSNSLSFYTDSRFRIDLFDAAGNPLPTPLLDVYQIVTGAPVRIGGTSGSLTPSIIGISPDNGTQGLASALVTIIGQNTHFDSTTVVTFGPGITVVGLQVSNSTLATATISIASGATPGPRDVTATTGSETAILSNSFLVTPSAPTSTVSVPNVVGLSQTAATTAITNAGLVLGTVTTASSSTVPTGNVISESPLAGTQVNAGSSVDLVVSSGPPQVAVPNVVGLTQSAATTSITSAGLVLGMVTTASSSTVPAGNVISENPLAGTQVNVGSAVNLVVSSGPAQVPVPNVVGLSQAAATSAIQNAGLALGTVTTASSSTVPAGNVISESPLAGTQVNVGSAVNLVVSSGPAQVAVPNVVGLSQSAATTAITNAGLVLGTVTTASSSMVPAGNVISENPLAGTQVNVGSSVDLVVSSGPAQVAVPNVVGLSQAAGTSAIQNAGLVLGTVTTATSSTVPAGNVISESPLAGTQVNVGSAVNLVVSIGPAQVAVPNVVGLSQSAATTAITNAGLVLGTVTTASSNTVPAGNVISESPLAGTQVNVGSAVNLVVSIGPAQVAVPNVVGLSQSAATTAITNAGLVLGTVTTASSNTVPAGNVISESPLAGTQVNVGSAVNLVVSSGPAQVAVPNVAGLSQAAAITAIQNAGLVLGTVTTASSSTVPAGNVISESPLAGTQVNVGSAVNLVVSTGPAQVVVPNVVGLTKAAATSAITGAGLVLGTVTTASSSAVAAGNVISENPSAGTQVNSGSAVNLVVSTGLVSEEVPNVVGLSQAAATTAIQRAGLVLGTVTTASSSTVPAGIVISQNPLAETHVSPGSAVNLVVSRGPSSEEVPNLVGLTQAAATTAIQHAGLVLGTVTTASSSTVPAGIVISQNPLAGTRVAPGERVNLVVSTGPFK